MGIFRSLIEFHVKNMDFNQTDVVRLSTGYSQLRNFILYGVKMTAVERELWFAYVPVQTASETVEPVTDLVLVADRWDGIDGRADTQTETHSLHCKPRQFQVQH